MPIDYNERRFAAEDAAAEAEELRQRLIAEEAAKPIPYARNEARRRVRDCAGEAREHKHLHPHDEMMNDALIKLQLAQQAVANLIETRVACRIEMRQIQGRKQ